MARGRRALLTRDRAAVLGLIAIPVLVLAFAWGIGRVRDLVSGSDEPSAVAILREGSTTDGEPRRTWTVEVAPEQVLIVSAVSVDLVRQDEGSRIDNTNPDRILLAAEGGHPYSVTIEDGRWVVVSKDDGRREFCDQERSRDSDWGVRYMPSSWPSDAC